MKDPKNLLETTLNLKEIAPNEFEAPSHNPGWNRIYGGQIISQAMLAGSLTVEENKLCHSVHAYFMRPGNPEQSVLYKVNPIRNGRSFATRTIDAFQGEEAILTMSASYHKDEPGFDHSDKMGNVEDPESLPPFKDVLEQYGDKIPLPVRTYFEKERPFELRPTNVERYLNPKPETPEQSFWVRALYPFNERPTLQQAALAYASDFTLLDTALKAHGKLLFDPKIMVASLDHAIWFHRPFNINNWLLYKQSSSNANGARSLCQGQFFDQNGTLIASTAQEGLTRPIK
jgi:acyl-CoA thioesterase-2